ncbi:MAG: Aminotransferase [Phycisphaerales bacterium]|nr:Aminotransferase [Phycisphaerales bacterium]
MSAQSTPATAPAVPASRNIHSYIGNPDAFPVLRNWAFFNHAGVSPLPRVAADAFHIFAQQAQQGAYLGTNWYADIEKLRQSAATMMNARRDEIAFVKNTSEGISIVANGIDWQFGDQVVTSSVEYPANVYPWMEQARSCGIKLVMVPEEKDDHGRRSVPLEKLLAAAADPKCRLVTISHVEYASGQRHDLAAIGDFCRKNGKLFCVDAIQSLGVFPVDVQAMKIDFLSADGHKWLLGPEGAGVFYCRRELIERTRPLMVGWMNVVDAKNYGDYNYRLRPDAGRFECGTHNIPGLLAFKASFDLLHAIGTEQLSRRIKEITDRLIIGLMLKGYQVISPRNDLQWSGIVSFTSPMHSHEQIVLALRKQHHIEIALREGRLRASPHFYNTEEQIDRLIDVLPGH